jgi:pimeloyl-ACP methyl ester carboxylesterase
MLKRSVWAMACGLLLLVVPGVRAADHYFSSDGVKIRYTDQGKGEPVLLIHGFGANVEMQWVLPGIRRALAKDYRVLALDCRGHGRSGKPHDPKKYGVAMVEDAVRLLDHLKIKKAHVVGYSMGALLTAKLLVLHPDRLRTATLGGAGGAGNDALTLRFEDDLATSLEQGKGIGPLMLALTPGGQPKPSPQQIEAVSKFFTAFNDTKALAAVVRGWKDLAVTSAELKANRVPTLAIVGGNDPLKKSVDALDGRLAHLKIVVIPGADHLTAISRPEFIRALKAFLDAHQGKKTKAAEPAAAGR